ncbi:MAG TPA: DinB family protein [Metabacillus sp.]|nr:DinB family protein [Metabacillus sp.]
MITKRPLPQEYDDYFERYMKLLPAGDLIEIYVNQMRSFYSLISRLSESEAEFRYDQGKWSIKEVVGHLSDAERMLSYRLFCIARGDSSPIPSINFGEYVIRGGFNKRPIQEIVEEWKSVRQSTLTLINNLRENDLRNMGTFRNNTLTVLAAACIIPGHVEHHINILYENYNI